MKPIIEVKNLKVIYNQGKENEFAALDDVSLEIYPQEYVVFLGPSGCGKSTLLYSILGLQPPTAGSIVINGQKTVDLPDNNRSEMRSVFFGIIFQNFNLINSLNVLENIILPRIFNKTNAASTKKDALDLVKRFRIEDRSHYHPNDLSGGQQQRVAICRALINNPEVVLADEPVGNLDHESAEIVIDALHNINKKDKKTVILVTHDPRFIVAADRVFYFNNGKLERIEKQNGRGEAQSVEEKDSKNVLSFSDLKKIARVHDYINVEHLKAWTLTNYLTQEFTSSQVDRLEGFMEELLSGKISEHEFFINLDKPLAEGGVGLYRTTAQKYTIQISKFLNEIKSVLNGHKNFNVVADRTPLVELIKKFIFEEYKKIATPQQHNLLGGLIDDLVKGKISLEDFEKYLHLGLKKDGLGLTLITAHRLTERIKIILSQVYAYC